MLEALIIKDARWNVFIQTANVFLRDANKIVKLFV